jgi:sugar lactone lactonase YvrE
LPEHIGSLALRKGGGTVVALGDGFYSLNFDNGTSTKLVDPDPGKQRIRLNDGKVDRQVRRGLYGLRGGTGAPQQRPPAQYQSTVTRLDRGIVCSNGPCWSPDGQTFYFAR